MLKFFLVNFGPLVFFYIVNLFGDVKMAIMASIGFVALELLYFLYKKIAPNFFFYFNAGMIVVFGGFDLLIKNPFFYRYEATLSNLLTALVFGLTLLKEKSIVQELAEAQGNVSNRESEDKSYFFRFYTIVWTGYFLIKAAIYFYIGYNSDFETALMMRMMIGKISFWFMMFISVGLGRKVWKLFEKYEMFPSQKKLSTPQ